MTKCKLKFKRNYEKGSEDDFDIVYDIINKDEDEIGDIAFDNEWKTWTFNAGISCFFDVTCLQQVIDKLKELNAKHQPLKQKGDRNGKI